MPRVFCNTGGSGNGIDHISFGREEEKNCLHLAVEATGKQRDSSENRLLSSECGSKANLLLFFFLPKAWGRLTSPESMFCGSVIMFPGDCCGTVFCGTSGGTGAENDEGRGGTEIAGGGVDFCGTTDGGKTGESSSTGRGGTNGGTFGIEISFLTGSEAVGESTESSCNHSGMEDSCCCGDESTTGNV